MRGASVARRMIAMICVVMGLGALSSTAHAQIQRNEISKYESAKQLLPEGLRVKVDVRVRPVPIGLSVVNNTGYRFRLSDSDSLLLKNTYIETGFAGTLSPAFMWAGAYVEALPVAVLKLRAELQYMRSFGTLGFWFTPGDGEVDSSGQPDWTLDRIGESQDNDGGVSGNGLLITAIATPQIKIKRFVLFSDIQYMHIESSLGRPFYEPYYDLLLNSREDVLILKPTAGWIFGQNPSEAFLLVAARWEKTWTRISDVQRDLPSLLFIWSPPKDWISWGRPRLAGQLGYWANHPNRTGIWFGGQVSSSFGVK